MKKVIIIVIAIALCLGLLSACGSNGGSASGSGSASSGGESGAYSTIKEGTLSVGIEIGYPPMEYFDEDGKTPIGFDVEMMTAIAEDMGLKLELIDTAWDGIFAGVDTDKYDVVVSCVSWTEDRSQKMLLSKTYVANAPVLVVPKDSTVADIKDLEGKTVAVQMETTADYLMQEYVAGGLGTELKQFDKVINAFDELKAGRTDAVCTDSVVAAFYLGDEASNYKTVWEADEKEPICMAFKKGNDALKAAVEASLDNIKASGKLAEIANKYFGTESVIDVE
ncbi:MAG: amino acid ABC transporter substrate-binding protein [Firmicutes bacterium]|nr:amino acid ABC transporter substrate-binding protein [Bacillota bacterium]